MDLSEIKIFVGIIISSVISLFTPIQDVVLAMLILFCVNGAFGLLADIIDGNGWSNKKALSFLKQCFIFFGTLFSLFAIGHFLHEEDETFTCVKIICIITTWVFGVNILRNARQSCSNGSSMYRLFDILYYIVSVQVVEKIPFVSNYIAARKSNNGDEK